MFTSMDKNGDKLLDGDSVGPALVLCYALLTVRWRSVPVIMLRKIIFAYFALALANKF
jgi:hypothetical protein